MKKKHLKLEWHSNDGNKVWHHSRLGDAYIYGYSDNWAWETFSLFKEKGAAYGTKLSLLAAQIAAEKELIFKFAIKK